MRRLVCAVTLLALTASGCTGSDNDDDNENGPNSSTNPSVAAIEQSRDLPDGGAVTVPAEAVPDDAELVIGTAGAPEVPAGLIGLAEPVDLAFSSGDQPQAPVSLTYPFDASAVPEGVDPADVYGISTYDEATGQWEPLPVVFDNASGTYTTELTSFSWKWPWQVDWPGIGATVNQAFGEALGKRAGQAKCTSPVAAPGWVRAVTSNEPATAIRTCAEGDPDDPATAVIQLVNNRPYGTLVNSPVDFAQSWTEDPKDTATTFTTAAFEAILEPNQVYVPAGARASFGFTDDGWTEAIVTAEPTQATLVADVAAKVLTSLVSKSVVDKIAGPFAAACLSPLIAAVNPTDSSTLLTKDVVRSWLAGSADCVQEAISSAATSGLLDRASAKRIDSTYRAVGRFGTYAALFSTEWDALDLLADQLVVEGSNTFSLTVNDPNILSADNLAVFDGTWSGPIDQRGSRPYRNVTTISINSDPNAGPTITGTVTYPGLGCSGPLRRFRLKDGVLLATEFINDDPQDTCVPVVRLRFTHQPDGTMRYETLATGYDTVGRLVRS